MTLSHDEATLSCMLQARDERCEKQKELIREYSLPLISFTVNMPGPRKNTPLSRRIFREGMEELERILMSVGKPALYKESRLSPAGAVAYLIVDMDEYALKSLVSEAENKHPLGRLWDFDVIGRNREHISRSSLGYPERKCLLCNETAHACARSRTHPLGDLLQKIDEITDAYFNKKDRV